MTGRVSLFAEAQALSGCYVAACYTSDYEHLLKAGLLRRMAPYLPGEEKLVLVTPDELAD